MSKAITNCKKCTDGKNKIPLSLHGNCELRPMKGYNGHCAMLTSLGIEDTDVNDDDVPDKKFKKRGK